MFLLFLNMKVMLWFEGIGLRLCLFWFKVDEVGVLFIMLLLMKCMVWLLESLMFMGLKVVGNEVEVCMVIVILRLGLELVLKM